LRILERMMEGPTPSPSPGPSRFERVAARLSASSSGADDGLLESHALAAPAGVQPAPGPAGFIVQERGSDGW
jgi:hypothetical protein